jgi:uncharacterized membrane protein YraQ (UPF0718 family)
VTVVGALGQALGTAFRMAWEILWPLVLGFIISGIVQAVVSKREIVRVLGDDRPRTLAKACAWGAASSSCSYAAVAIARSLFRKGATFTAAMAFELASTNLVVELAVIMIILLGWRFALAELLGAPLMVVFLAVLFRSFLTRRLVHGAHAQAERGIAGRMEGHAEMHMEVTKGSLWQRMTSEEGITAISHYFVMDWVSVWKDIAGGLVIAGALAAWVPGSWWSQVFLAGRGSWSLVLGPLVGPAIAILSFVCSVGNIPLAAVLWNGGISFGGVLAFVFADLIVLPILDIYRKYYGWKAMWFILGTFYASMTASALVIEFLFQGLGLIPARGAAAVIPSTIAFNYTAILNIILLGVAALLVRHFFRTGGLRMLAAMKGPGQRVAGDHDAHRGHAHGP